MVAESHCCSLQVLEGALGRYYHVGMRKDLFLECRGARLGWFIISRVLARDYLLFLWYFS